MKKSEIPYYAQVPENISEKLEKQVAIVDVVNSCLKVDFEIATDVQLQEWPKRLDGTCKMLNATELQTRVQGYKVCKVVKVLNRS